MLPVRRRSVYRIDLDPVGRGDWRDRPFRERRRPNPPRPADDRYHRPDVRGRNVASDAEETQNQRDFQEFHDGADCMSTERVPQ